MANGTVKNKSEKTEKAISRLFGQMDKTVAKRQWSASAYASLITYVAEAYGAKFPAKEDRDAFRKELEDSDLGYSSNFKKYAATRGFLPAKDEYATASFD
jgi:hypothetical protein